MDFRHLHTFVAVAEGRSFTRAAQSLSITQAAVSQHIAALEKTLDARLFDRGGRCAVLTPAGQRLHEYARRILDLVDSARQELGGEATEIRGTLKIAASTVPSQGLLPRLLASFRESFPLVHELVLVSDSAQAIRAVQSAEADCGLVGALPHGTQLHATAIADDELVLVVGPDHPLADVKAVSVNDLCGEPIITREAGSGSRHCVERALQTAGVSPDGLSATMEMNSNDAIRAAVEQGLAAAFLSRATIERDLVDGRLVTIDVEGVQATRKLYLITDPRRTASLPTRSFLEFIEKKMS